MMTITVESPILLFCEQDFRGSCNTEDTDLKSWCAWFRYHHPELSLTLVHCPNEGDLPPQARNSQYEKGVLFGCPDIIVMAPHNGYHGFVMECKRKNPALSLKTKKDKEHFEKQCKILKDWGDRGYYCCAAFGYHKMIEAFQSYLQNGQHHDQQSLSLK
jgi:hypothetical protein